MRELDFSKYHVILQDYEGVRSFRKSCCVTALRELDFPEDHVIMLQDYEGVEIFQKIIFQVELLKTVRDHDFGLVAEAELADDAEQEDELCVFISEVTKGGLAHRKGDFLHCQCKDTTVD